MFWGKKGEQPAITAQEITLESVVRFHVDNGLQLENGFLRKIPAAKKGQNDKDLLRNAVRRTIESLNGTDCRTATLQKFQEKAERLLEMERLENRIVDEVYSDRVEAVRSRVMIKAIRAGLDRCDAFYSLLDKDKVPDILAIERWVEKTDAYQAYLNS